MESKETNKIEDVGLINVQQLNNAEGQAKINDDKLIMSIQLEQFKQRERCLSRCIDILYDDQQAYINSAMEDNNYNKIAAKLSFVESINSGNTNDPFIKKALSEKFTSQEFIVGLAINALNQFCFWYNTSFQEGRILQSSDIGLNRITDDFEFLYYAVTLRKERITLNNQFRDYILNKVYKGGEAKISNVQLVYSILRFEGFNYDLFRKKKELFLMMLFRYFNMTELPTNFRKLEKFVNPAIDYQVPKMLDALGITDYPHRLREIIKNGELIPKDSYDELFIRALSYYTLINMESELLETSYNGIPRKYNQIDLDWFFWSNRNNEEVVGAKHHCTLTEDY